MVGIQRKLREVVVFGHPGRIRPIEPSSVWTPVCNRGGPYSQALRKDYVSRWRLIPSDLCSEVVEEHSPSARLFSARNPQIATR